MKKESLISLLLVFILSFSIIIYFKSNKNENSNSVEMNFNSDLISNEQIETSYDAFLTELNNKRKNSKTTIEAKNLIFDALANKIPKYWIGTVWDFNGITRKPNEGEIACGYFITNTLSDLGFKIQRVKLAQLPSSEMINRLCINVKRFSDFEKTKKYINEQPNESIFIIGLDFHTGYIIKTDNQIYFLHSNYLNKEGVIKEDVNKSKALNASKSFMIGNLTANEKLINNWLKE